MEMGEGGGTELKDIFALVSYHGTVLERILTSCFLGSDRELPSSHFLRFLNGKLTSTSSISIEQALQRVLIRCFTAVLGFGKLVRDIQMEELDDEEALPILEKLHSTFEVRF